MLCKGILLNKSFLTVAYSKETPSGIRKILNPAKRALIEGALKGRGNT